MSNPKAQTLDLRIAENDKNLEFGYDHLRSYRNSNQSGHTPSFQRGSRLASEHHPEIETVEKDQVRSGKQVLVSKKYEEGELQPESIQPIDEEEDFGRKFSPEKQEKDRDLQRSGQDT